MQIKFQLPVMWMWCLWNCISCLMLCNDGSSQWISWTSSSETMDYNLVNKSNISTAANFIKMEKATNSSFEQCQGYRGKVKLGNVRFFLCLTIMPRKGIHCLIKQHAMKTHWVNVSTTPPILNLNTRWRWVVSFMSWLLYLYGKNP